MQKTHLTPKSAKEIIVSHRII